MKFPNKTHRTASRLVVAMLCLVMLAGCAGSDADAGVGTDGTGAPPDAAPEPTVGESEGSIAGVVTDEDLLPLPNVRVTIVETLDSAVTDASGAFTINDLEPGSYRLEFARTGYNSALRPADVAAGEVTRVELQLDRLEVAPDGYHWSVPFTGHIQFGQWTVQWAQHVVNQTPVDQLLCDPCSFLLYLEPNASDAITEVDFTPSVNLAVVNQAVGVGITRVTEEATPSYIHSDTYGPRDQMHWSEESIDTVNEMEVVRVQLHGPNPGTYGPGIAFDQRVDIWQTFFHYEDAPDGFTALPPE